MANIYAEADSTGKIIAFYADDIYSPSQIPQDAVLITNEEWQDHVSNNRYIIQSSQVVLAPLPTDVQLLTKAKNDKSHDLMYKRDLAIAAGFTSTSASTNYSFYTDKDSLSEFAQEATMLNLDSTITTVSWFTKDKGYVTSISRADFISILKDLRSFKQSQFDKYAQLLSQVQAATTADAVNQITW